MRNSFQLLNKFCLVLAFAFIFAGCSKDKDPAPAPAPKGTLLTYTNINDRSFDRIDIIVDGKVAGTLTKPFAVKPTCGAAASASVTSIELSVGTHKVYAIQYKNGENVGEWNEETETINDGKCTPINWTE
ncbi:hypothetical protein SAMN04487996_12044 [Dyadobacter soli]|uniref:PEGA domain-containing protein n=1 Tax=Dyadobacter soli TaxID=659014 RepID=A0A1G7VE12_9BACT|nr:hypothetical protein [Dyadobacter soli]SDG57798.1 hypothetical protein SAMN04487996_12044 [Dyadobacter soli]